MNIYDYGHFEDDVFILDQEISVEDEFGHQVVVKSIDFSMMQLPPDIDREDVIHAMLNPVLIKKLEE
jgi:hypothetical protein